MDYRQKMVVDQMTPTQKIKSDDDDDEDLEALRLAALKSLRTKDTVHNKKGPTVIQPIVPQVVSVNRLSHKDERRGRPRRGFYHNRQLCFQRQNGNMYYPSPRNPNLIAIVPMDEPPIAPSTDSSCLVKEEKTEPNSEAESREISKFQRFKDTGSGSEDEDPREVKKVVPEPLESKDLDDGETVSETVESIEQNLQQTVKTNKEPNDREEDEEEEEEGEEGEDEEEEEGCVANNEDDDDILLMADLEEEDSLERLMDEMEREMNVEKKSEQKSKIGSKREAKDAKKSNDTLMKSQDQKFRTTEFSKRGNQSPTFSSSITKIERRSISPQGTGRIIQRRKSLSPKSRSRKKSPRRSPRRSPKRSPNRLMKKLPRELLRYRSPKKSPLPRYSPRPRSPKLSPRPKSPRFSPRRSPIRSPLRSPRRLSPKGRSPKRSTRSRSPRLQRSRSPRRSRSRSPRYSPLRLSPLSRSPNLSPRRLSPRRLSPRRMSPRSRSPGHSPRRSPKLSPRRVSPHSRSPCKSPWSSPRQSPLRFSPKRKRSPKEKKHGPRSLSPDYSMTTERIYSKSKSKDESGEKLLTTVDVTKDIEATTNPILEARRKKFESTKPIDPVNDNKTIKLSNKKDEAGTKIDNDSVGVGSVRKIRKLIDNLDDSEELDSKVQFECEFEELAEDEDVQEDTTITVVQPVDMEVPKVDKEKSLKKKRKRDKEIYQVGKLKSDLPLSERIGKDKKCKKRKDNLSNISNEEDVVFDESAHDEEGDLRTELSRRRAERLNRTAPIQSARLVQSAFKGVVNEAVKNNAKVNQRHMIKSDEKSNAKEVRRVTVLHRALSDLHDSEDETPVDSKVPVRFRLGINKQISDSRDSKASRKSSKRSGRKVKHKNNLSTTNPEHDL